jgi:predicted nucleic acid-binding Zn ribbon protein
MQAKTFWRGVLMSLRRPSGNWSYKRRPGVREVTCIYCGEVFQTKSGKKKICDKEACQAQKLAEWAERRNARKRAQRKVIGVVGERICVECGKKFQPRQLNQVICGSHECRCALKRHRERKIREAQPALPKRKCEVCGEEYQPVASNQKFCSKVCRLHREKEKQNKRRGHAAPEFSGSTYRPRVSPDPLYGHGHRWCGVPVESTSFAPLG